ncbi:MAG: ribonuclease HII [Elusimicrobia bacterium]|nr:ribonuclease HII [Elusimicrobiota bacterium]MBU2614016.1 ribonuclease HII [Elusimicrobiota bacterium]
MSGRYVAGVDEAGRGPLAGPVVASAVILPKNIRIKGIADSKTLNQNQREKAFQAILKHALAIGVGICDHKKIDSINIFNASYLAMKLAVKKLKIKPELIFVDGPFKIPGINIAQKAIIGGDGKSACIAAASIIAKVTRDRLMCRYDKKFPRYGFKKHKGYPTKEHRIAIKKYGITKIHRLSFTLY